MTATPPSPATKPELANAFPLSLAIAAHTPSSSFRSTKLGVSPEARTGENASRINPRAADRKSTRDLDGKPLPHILRSLSGIFRGSKADDENRDAETGVTRYY